MVLPEGLRWVKRQQYSAVTDALSLDGEFVAMLLDKVRDGWFARQEGHKTGTDEPIVTRHCSSYEAGKRGCELSAACHEVRLWAEVAERIANRASLKGAGGGSNFP